MNNIFSVIVIFKYFFLLKFNVKYSRKSGIEKAVLRHLLVLLNASRPVAPLSNRPLKTFAHAFGFIAKVSRTGIYES